MTRENTARNIRLHLADKRWTQADLARELGITRAFVGRMLNRPEYDLTDGQVKKIAKALGVSVSRLDRVVEL